MVNKEVFMMCQSTITNPWIQKVIDWYPTKEARIEAELAAIELR